ncbi:hypothetical Protein YC6258_03772 [Gynuella sunshinyii YC6258]|uniref:Uncharacterized protein n=2 Tax=Gynuella sunshinyii TaxID=1445505 RepID=A0A0C5UYB0_9GAMM|nr:hypothetical Protein YC6258_00193 [Gynuella sunshinyii YC6258]AJQ95808.1 hypothetical Protein YC6258_03772 [Gynuella sunshinyii YC6258]
MGDGWSMSNQASAATGSKSDNKRNNVDSGLSYRSGSIIFGNNEQSNTGVWILAGVGLLGLGLFVFGRQ